jgi:uncharacterized protein (TIGR02145 family)
MKTRLHRFIQQTSVLLLFVAFAAGQLQAQFIITQGNKKPYANDSVILFLNNIRGSVHWETSGNLIVWDSLAGQIHDTLALHVDHSAFYRAVIKEGTCAPIYSDTILIAELYDDRDQQYYDIVKIGNQWWMAKNLNYYTPEGSAYFNYDSVNYSAGGRLYNILTAQHVCMPGWHLPSEKEWEILEMTLGMDASVIENTGWRGTNEGAKLFKGANEGFNADFAGMRYIDSNFYGYNTIAAYWSSTEYESSGEYWYRGINASRTDIHRDKYGDVCMHSVRCVKNEKPYIVTDSVSNITDTSVVVYGTFFDSRGSDVTSMGACWDTKSNPLYDGNFVTVNKFDSVFSIAIPYLTSGTTYYVRAFAVNATGVGYGNTITIITKSPIPVIITSKATSITTTSARSGGNIINSKGLQINSRGVCWSTHQHPTVNDSKTINGSGTGSYVSDLTGLTTNTQYYIRAYVTTPAGDFYGDEISMKTLAINETGSLTDARDGNIYKTVKIGFQWWMAENLTYYTADGSAFYENDSIRYSAGGKLYNVLRAQNVCMSGWHLPSEDEWRTLEMTLGMDTTVISNTGWRGTNEGAKLFPGAPDGFDAEFTGLLSIDGKFYGYGSIAAFWSSSEYQSSGEYWYRGINSGRTDIHREKYGNVYMHSVRCVKNDKPYLVTDSVGNIGELTASAYSRILSNGGRTITARGVCWSKNPGPTVANSHTSDGTGNLPFTSTITGLDQNATYYLRAYATNDQGTSYGNEITFITLRALPVVTTASVSAITSATATCGGNVVNNKGFTITARGVCWSTLPGPTTTNAHTTNGTGTGAFTSSITGLQPNTKYYVRAYATSGAGTGYGDEVSFRTSYQYPTGTITDARDGHVYTTITIGDQLWMGENLMYRAVPGSAFYKNDSTGYSQYGRLYNWQTALNACPSSWHLPTDDEWKTLEIAMGMSISDADNSGWRGTTEATKLVEGGTSGFEAAFGGQCYPSNNYGDEGVIGTFWTSTQTDASNAWYRGFNITHGDIHRESYLKTYKYSVRCLKNELPVLTTAAVTGKSDTSAYSGGTITYDGGAPVTARGVCWGLSHNPAVSGDTTLNGTGTGSYVSFMTGLDPGKTYYVRAYAINSEGTAYGNEVSVTTLTGVPRVTTSTVNSITDTTAVSGGNVTSNGGLTVSGRGVCWSTSPVPAISDSHTSNGTGTGVFTSSITGLLPNTTYYVRAYATNSKGTGYGSQISFSTSASVPKVTTAAITGITESSAVGGGSVTSDGGLTVTARGICWSTSHVPTVSDSKTQDGSGIGSFTSYLNGLDDMTTYYVRAYATNTAGTGYGEEISFTTTNAIGSLTDIRDGQIYATVKIDEGWWMAENMNYADSGSVYYGNDSLQYADTYGRLYTWTAMMNGKASSTLIPSGVQGVCPAGWHIPSEGEWTALISYLGGASVAGNALKETGTAHWSSTTVDVTNLSGFTALPAGIVTNVMVSSNIERRAYFWSATEVDATTAKRWTLTRSAGTVATDEISKDNHISVRCKKD